MTKESIYPIHGQYSPKRWRDQLSKELDLEADSGMVADKVYYDSFDWRLYHAGLYLVWDNAELGPMFRLVRLDDDSVQDEIRANGSERFWSDLPDSVLRDRLRKILGIRALLPRFPVRLRGYGLRMKDKEGKTRARLFVESCRLRKDDGQGRLIMNRLRLQPVRGYQKAMQRIQKHLEKHYRLQAEEDRLFTRTLDASGIQAGDYSNKLNIQLQPDTRADAAVREVLSILAKAMESNYQGTVDDLDTEFLHDFRVAVRRTRSMLSELRTVFPAAALKRFKTEFGWLGGLTSEVRDLDVYLLKFDGYRQAVPEHLQDDLEPLRRFLQRLQRLRQSTHLAPALKSARYRKLSSGWARYLDTPLAKRPAAPDAARSILEVAQRKTWRMHKRVIREGQAIDRSSPHEDLHELRKSCKKLRYLMEFFQSLFPADEIKVLIKELKRLQDNLGDFQDLEVQIHSLEQFSADMREQGELSAGTEQAIIALEDRLKEEMGTVRAHFEERFQRFALKPTRNEFKKLFRREKAGVAP